MCKHSDGLLDELNGTYEDDMGQCGLHEDDGDVVFTQHMTEERALNVTARTYMHSILEMLDEREEGLLQQLQSYIMLAIVQRDMFIQSTL